MLTSIQYILFRLIPAGLLVSLVIAAFLPVDTGVTSQQLPATAMENTTETTLEPPAQPASSAGAAQHRVFAPMVVALQEQSLVVQDAWTADSQGDQATYYFTGDEIQYWVSGTSTFYTSQDIDLRWNLSPPCGETQLYSDTVSLEPGEWQHVHSNLAPDCSGVFTATVELSGDMVPTQTLSSQFAVNQTSMVVVSDQQGFDRCELSDVEEMAEWWENSPYQVYNLYLGGINFYCKENPLDAAWVQQVAAQGWNFIQTWVGPQAPCKDHVNYRFSYDPETAYNQGRLEAQSAVEASWALGFTGENIIYYDLEGYHDDVSSCHNAVSAFLSGWTERLHEFGIKSGAYGGACSSFVARWADFTPPPDDVWIAHWYRSQYDPNASVWDATCVPNDLWADHQRIKQYAGDHVETWGDVSLGIDSDVLDGEIVSLGPGFTGESAGGRGTRLEISGVPIKAVGMLSADQFWVLSEERLLVTHDRAGTWLDITPAGVQVLDVDFIDPQTAWLVSRALSTGELRAFYTQDGGATWTDVNLFTGASRASLFDEAFIDAPDPQQVFVVLRQPSGSSFSLGRLFVTEDGGENWQERSAPLGEPAEFHDGQTGWMAGGPAGDQLYRTTDGGHTWQRQAQDLRGADDSVVGLPQGVVSLDFDDRGHGLAAIQAGACEGDKLDPGARPFRCAVSWQLVWTDDGGLSWHDIGLRLP